MLMRLGVEVSLRRREVQQTNSEADQKQQSAGIPQTGSGAEAHLTQNLQVKQMCGKITHHSAGHLFVVVGVGQGQVLKHVIVRGQGQRAPVALEHCSIGQVAATTGRMGERREKREANTLIHSPWEHLSTQCQKAKAVVR